MPKKFASEKFYRGVRRHLVYAYDRITSEIYVGTNLCCEAHFAKLKQLGFEADLDLEAEKIERPPVKFKNYLRLPVKDHRAPSASQLWRGTAFINRFVGRGKKIYVHCKNGHGRSPTMVAAYLIRYRSMSVAQAINYVKARRRGMHLRKVQLQALRKWAKLISKKYKK